MSDALVAVSHHHGVAHTERPGHNTHREKWLGGGGELEMLSVLPVPKAALKAGTSL